MHTTTHLAAEVVSAGGAETRLAMAALFERILTRIHRFFLRTLRDPHEADECLQRTVVLLEESLRTRKYDPERSFNTWMWLKARTVYAQWCRDRSRQPRALPEGPDPAASDHELAAAERSLEVEAILARLAEELRPEAFETFVLYYMSGLTQEQAAQALDCTARTVRNRLREAHAVVARLRPALVGEATP